MKIVSRSVFTSKRLLAKTVKRPNNYSGTKGFLNHYDEIWGTQTNWYMLSDVEQLTVTLTFPSGVQAFSTQRSLIVTLVGEIISSQSRLGKTQRRHLVLARTFTRRALHVLQPLYLPGTPTMVIVWAGNTDAWLKEYMLSGPWHQEARQV